jgi:hypothetical protein
LPGPSGSKKEVVLPINAPRAQLEAATSKSGTSAIAEPQIGELKNNFFTVVLGFKVSNTMVIVSAFW